MTIRGHFSAIVCALALVLLVGCAGSKSSPVDPSSSAHEKDAPSNKEWQSYFEALASNDPSEISKAIDMAVPGSNAAAYATYLSAVTQSQQDGGVSSDPSHVKDISDGFSICSESDGIPCYEYTGLKHEAGKVSDLLVSGKGLGDRITLGGGESRAAGDLAEVSMIAAYQTQANSLFVVFEVTSHTDGLFLGMSHYRAPDGGQSEYTAGFGPTELNDGSSAHFTLIFEGADIGGNVTIKLRGDAKEGSATFETR